MLCQPQHCLQIMPSFLQLQPVLLLLLLPPPDMQALAQLPLRSSEVKVLSTCAGMLRRLPDHGRTTALGKGLHAARTQLEDLLKDAAKPSQEEVEAEIEVRHDGQCM